MKRFAFALALAFVASSLCASQVASDAVYGMMCVPVSTQKALICVPWDGADGNAVKVKDLVMTNNLAAADQLYVLDGTSYKGWILTDGAWVPVKSSSTIDGITTAAGADAASLARGLALWLVRGSSTPVNVFVYGKYNSQAVSTIVAAGSTDTPTYALVANATTSDKAISAIAGGITGARAGDWIVIPGKKTLQYNGSAWKVMIGNIAVGAPADSQYKVPAGQGFWYVSRSAGEKTISL